MGNADVDALYEKWLGWFEQVANETHTLFLYRDYWRGLAEMTQANPEIPASTIFYALGVWYAATQATSVRRQLDSDPRSVSFRNLLEDMAAHPEVMSRERHLGIWGDADWETLANENYDEFAGSGNNMIDPARTRADIDRLKYIVDPIVTFVNKVIAHTDERQRTSAPTYNELNAAIDEIGEMLKKYSSLLTASIALVEPVHQADWRQAFSVAWLKA
jgi:hypothetical protein